MRTFRMGCGLARVVVTVLNPRVHSGLPDLICRAERACLFKSGELVGAERPEALVVARDIPNRIVESRHKALPDVLPALLKDETSLRATRRRHGRQAFATVAARFCQITTSSTALARERRVDVLC
jgi:hypothetical protein